MYVITKRGLVWVDVSHPGWAQIYVSTPRQFSPHSPCTATSLEIDLNCKAGGFPNNLKVFHYMPPFRRTMRLALLRWKKVFCSSPRGVDGGEERLLRPENRNDKTAISLWNSRMKPSEKLTRLQSIPFRSELALFFILPSADDFMCALWKSSCAGSAWL